MPSRYYKRDFKVGNYYHLWNRGAGNKKIFRDNKDFSVFVLTLSYYLRFPTGRPLSRVAVRKPETLKKHLANVPPSSAHLIAYTLHPDHFHLLLHQTTRPDRENSISNLMRRLSITYAMHYNDKYNTSGNIFQSKYKNIGFKDKDVLLELTKYLHREPLELPGTELENLPQYQFSSYHHYLNPQTKPTWLHPQDVLDYLNEKAPEINYEEYVVSSPAQKDLLKGYTLD